MKELLTRIQRHNFVFIHSWFQLLFPYGLRAGRRPRPVYNSAITAHCMYTSATLHHVYIYILCYSFSFYSFPLMNEFSNYWSFKWWADTICRKNLAVKYPIGPYFWIYERQFSFKFWNNSQSNWSSNMRNVRLRPRSTRFHFHATWISWPKLNKICSLYERVFLNDR